MKGWNKVFRFFTTLLCPIKAELSWVVEVVTVVDFVVDESGGDCSVKLVVT